MKKVLTIATLCVMLVMTFATIVNAATSAELADKLYAKGAKYGMTTADKVKVERYLSENPVTDAQADAILAKADEAIAVMEKAGVTDYTKLTAAQKNEIKAIAQSSAELIDAKLVFKKGAVEIYNEDGKLIESVSLDGGKLAYTGNNINTVIGVSAVAIIALAIGVVTKKRIANAK